VVREELATRFLTLRMILFTVSAVNGVKKRWRLWKALRKMKKISEATGSMALSYTFSTVLLSVQGTLSEFISSTIGRRAGFSLTLELPTEEERTGAEFILA